MFPINPQSAEKRGLLVGRVVVPVATSSIIFNGLDGEKDGYYNLVGTIIPSAAAVTSFFLDTNNTSATGYNQNWWQCAGNNATKSATAVNNTQPYMGVTESIVPHIINYHVIYSNGLVSCVGMALRGHAQSGIQANWWRKKDAIQNLTSLTLSGVLGVGTTINLYRCG